MADSAQREIITEFGSCQGCGFWETAARKGICRRMPPGPQGQWPPTGPDDWCGEFKATEK